MVPLKILIVDDDADVLIALERVLEGEGYQTVTAWSGRDALVQADCARFDLVLVDEHLYDLEASTLCDELLRLQPGARRFLMHNRKGAVRASSDSHVDVCKWEHNELKDQIRRCMAA